MSRWLPILSILGVAVLIAVWLLRDGRARPTPVVVEAESVVLPQVAEGAPVVELAQEDAPPSRGAIEVLTNEAKRAEGATAPAELATLAVLVVDPDRNPVSRARVRVWRRSGAPPSMHVDGTRGTLDTVPITGEEGRAEFEVPAATDLWLDAWGEEGKHDRESTAVTALSIGERREVEIELPVDETVALHVRVLAADDRSPIAGALVNVFQGRVDAVNTVTDHEGFFRLSLPSWQRADVKVAAPGYGMVYLESGRGHETRETAQVVLLERSATLRARVVDAGGAGIAEAVLRLWTEAYYLGVSNSNFVYLPSPGDPQWKATADSAGLYIVEELPPHVPFHVEIYRAEKDPKLDLPTLSLSPGEVREVEWSVDTGCLLEGSVVDQLGQVVSGQTIWMKRGSSKPAYFQTYHSGEVVLESTTDAEGRFAFRDMTPGAWLIGPAPGRGDSDPPDLSAIAAYGERIEIPEGVAWQEVELRVHRGLYISGRVVDPDGMPAPRVWLWGSSESGFLSAEASSDGAFALGPLLPGRYTLVARGWEVGNSEPIEALAGEEGVVLALRAAGNLSGKVIDETGKGCAARVCFARPGDAWVAFVQAGDDGAFRFDGLEPGTYALAASGTSRRAGVLREVSVVARTDTGGLVITLEPGALLRVKYAGTEGFLQCQVRSEGATVAANGIPAGGREEATVPPGRLTVECTWGGKTETKEFEIAAGEERELVFGAD